MPHPTPTLDDPRTRIAVATQHINALERRARRFIRQSKHHIEITKNRKTGLNDLRLVDVPVIPTEYAIIVGMVAHNLRSALDGLACQLALLNRGGGSIHSICERTQFLIRIRGPRAKPSRSHPKFSWQSHAITPLGKFAKCIERLQPYKQGNGGRKNPLWLLHELNNTDKHRILVLLAHRARAVTVTPLPRSGRIIDNRMVVSWSGPFRISAGHKVADGTKIGDFPPLTGPPQMDMSTHVSLEMIFGDACPAVRRKPVFPTLRQVCEHVHEIVESFAPEF